MPVDATIEETERERCERIVRECLAFGGEGFTYIGAKPWEMTLEAFTHAPEFYDAAKKIRDFIRDGVRYEVHRDYSPFAPEKADAMRRLDMEEDSFHAMRRFATMLIREDACFVRGECDSALQHSMYSMEMNREAHRRLVCIALRWNETVPEAVLADYPDILARWEAKGLAGFRRATPWPGSEERVGVEAALANMEMWMEENAPLMDSIKAKLRTLSPGGKAHQRESYRLSELNKAKCYYDMALPMVREHLARCVADDEKENR